jgi:membrane associated rhomboid family serine protease
MLLVNDSEERWRFPLMTLFIIAGCAAVFWWEQRLGDAGLRRAFLRWGFVPAQAQAALAHGDKLGIRDAVVTLFTSQFLHGGWLHVIGNMWALWIFGDNVEDRLGRVLYLVFYLGCGVAAAVAHGLMAGASPLPAIGASGAISGVMGAYLVWCWRARVTLLVPIVIIPLPIKVPAVAYLLFWIGTQWLAAATTAGQSVHLGGVAWWAHIGGFTCGVLGAFLIEPRKEYEVVRE